MNWSDWGAVILTGWCLHPRPDVGCVVKGIAIIGALAVLALIIYMGGVH